MFHRDDLRSMTYSRVYSLHREGYITAEDYEWYCWLWRDGAPRFSSVGKTAAGRHARRNNLPLPRSDQPYTEGEDLWPERGRGT